MSHKATERRESDVTAKKLIGVFICIAGLMIFFYPNFCEYRMHQEVKRIETDIQNSNQNSSANKTDDSSADNTTDSNTSSKESEETPIAYDRLYGEMVEYNEKLFKDGQKLTDVFSYEDVPVDLSEFGTDNVIGYINIPSIDCSLPLYLGASLDHLSRGAAVMGNTSMPIGGSSTNCVIAGHRGYQGVAFFRNINNISVGDSVEIVNPWGTLHYKAVSTEIVVPTDKEPLLIRNGEDAVTLVSCHPYMVGGGKQRIIVHCIRDESSVSVSENVAVTEQQNEATDTSINSSSNEAMHTDDESFIIIEDILRTTIPIMIIVLLAIILFPHKRKRKK